MRYVPAGTLDRLVSGKPNTEPSNTSTSPACQSSTSMPNACALRFCSERSWKRGSEVSVVSVESSRMSRPSYAVSWAAGTLTATSSPSAPFDGMQPASTAMMDNETRLRAVRLSNLVIECPRVTGNQPSVQSPQGETRTITAPCAGTRTDQPPGNRPSSSWRHRSLIDTSSPAG